MRPAVGAGLSIAIGLGLAPLAARADGPADGGGPPAASSRVERRYVLHCGGCHGVDGRGTPGVTPTLHGLASLAETPAGRAYLMRVPGVAQAPLSDADLATLLDWVVARFSGVAPGQRFDAAEVGRLRDRPLRDPVAARAALTAGRRGAGDGSALSAPLATPLTSPGSRPSPAR